ncbi:MAG: LysM peptidoglycan-binding domain-containing protein [Ginsengibacter sp.]
MSKWLMIIFFTFITSNFLFAQQNNLEIKGTGNNLSIEHIVSPKESFYSIGRMYNVNPKELATFNNLKLQSGLSIGDNLKIPLDKNNFLQAGKAENDEVLIPVYHTVQSGETLYRLGVNYNKVALASLKKWNHLQSDAVSVGVPMIVGFLKVDKAQSSLAKGKTGVENEVVATPQKEEKPVAKTPEVVTQTAPAQKKPEPVKTEKTETTTVQPEPTKATVATVNTKSNINFSGGYFKNLYGQQTANKSAVSKSGSAAVFKSTSGWQDGKYYCFNNDATPGTVLKVTDNTTGKIVYAKVLDAIPDIKENAGLLIIISNAASEELGVGENKFDCTVSYAK